MAVVAVMVGRSIGVRRRQSVARNYTSSTTNRPSRHRGILGDSSDGTTIAFVARAGSKRQIRLRLLAGGAPLQITRDDTGLRAAAVGAGSEFPDLFCAVADTRSGSVRFGKSPLFGGEP